MTVPSAADLLALFILPISVASISWTFTHEEIFREPREWFQARSTSRANGFRRKFFYALTCEYCLSHYVTILVLVLTRFHLFFPDLRGYFVSGFSVVWIANIYMSLYGRVRLDIKRDRAEIAAHEADCRKRPVRATVDRD